MNVRQQKFCDYYLQSGNATEAAIKAGYSKRTAYSIGQRLLKNVETKNYIDEYREKARKSRIATAEEVLEFWAEVMRNEEISPKDRLRASENLGKILISNGVNPEDNDFKVVLSIEDVSGGEDEGD